MKVGVIIQARMGSSRLPGKVLLKLIDKPVLWHVVERLKQCQKIDKIIIATTINNKDDDIYSFCIESGIDVYRGSELDVLDRYYWAAKTFNIDPIVRITADCPLVDPYIVDQVISKYLLSPANIAANIGISSSSRTFPRGFDTEVFSFVLLERAWENAGQTYQREHVTPYMYETQSDISLLKAENNFSKYRLTLDTDDDWTAISEIYDKLYKGKHNFYMNEIIDLIHNHNFIYEINKNVGQKNIYEK